jgi:hypothetical protein
VTIDQTGIVETAQIHQYSESRNNNPDNGLARFAWNRKELGFQKLHSFIYLASADTGETSPADFAATDANASA